MIIIAQIGGKNLIAEMRYQLDEKRNECHRLSKEITKLRQTLNNDELRAEREELNVNFFF